MVKWTALLLGGVAGFFLGAAAVTKKRRKAPAFRHGDISRIPLKAESACIRLLPVV